GTAGFTTLATAPGGGSTLSLTPSGGTLSGPGYAVRLSGVPHVLAYGGPGDRFYPAGPGGGDVFVGTPGFAYLYGDGFWDQADNFGLALATETAGSNTAILTGSAEGDTLVGTPAWAYLSGTQDGQGFFNQANGFSVVI